MEPLVIFIVIAIIFIWSVVIGIGGAIIYWVCEEESGIDKKRLFWLMVFCGPLCWLCIGVIEGMCCLDRNSYRIVDFLRIHNDKT